MQLNLNPKESSRWRISGHEHPPLCVCAAFLLVHWDEAPMPLHPPPNMETETGEAFRSEPSLGPVSRTRSGVLDPEGTPLPANRKPALGSLRWSGGIHSSGGSGAAW